MADQKLTELTADASPTTDDLVYVVNDPSGTAADRKVTLANLLALAPHWVDRGDPSAADFTAGSLTTDNTWRDLDLSSIAPADSTFVLLNVNITDDVTGSYLQFRKNGNSNVFNAASIRVQAANETQDGNLIVACDSNRVIEYRGSNVTFASINIVVAGWYIDTVN